MFGSGSMKNALAGAWKKGEAWTNQGHDAFRQEANLANTNYRNTMINAERTARQDVQDYYKQQQAMYQPYIQQGQAAGEQMQNWLTGTGRADYINSQPVQAQLAAAGQDARRAANATGRLYSGQDAASRDIMAARMGNELADSQYAKLAQQQALGAQFSGQSAGAAGQMGSQLAGLTGQYQPGIGQAFWNTGYALGNNEITRNNRLTDLYFNYTNAKNQATQAGWQNAIGLTSAISGFFPKGI